MHQWQDKEYREAYMEASIEQGIAWQIRINRQIRGVSLEELSAAIQVDAAKVTGLEDPEQGDYDLETLVKLAKFFGCALSVKFIPYSQLIAESSDLSESSQYAQPFVQEMLDGTK